MEISSLCVCVNVGAVIFFKKGKKFFLVLKKYVYASRFFLRLEDTKEKRMKEERKEREREKGRAPLSLLKLWRRLGGCLGPCFLSSHPPTLSLLLLFFQK